MISQVSTQTSVSRLYLSPLFTYSCNSKWSDGRCAGYASNPTCGSDITIPTDHLGPDQYWPSFNGNPTTMPSGNGFSDTDTLVYVTSMVSCHQCPSISKPHSSWNYFNELVLTYACVYICITTLRVIASRTLSNRCGGCKRWNHRLCQFLQSGSVW